MGRIRKSRPTQPPAPELSLCRCLRLTSRKCWAIATDTEYEGPETLTVQAAVRATSSIVAAVYHSASVPVVDVAVDPGDRSRYVERIVVRPPAPISTSLSPGRIVTRLLGAELEDLLLWTTRRIGHTWLAAPHAKPPAPNAVWDDKAQRWKLPVVVVRLIGHFLPADFSRVFGTAFYESLFDSDPGAPAPLALEQHRLLRLRSPGAGFGLPDVEYAWCSACGRRYCLRLETWDTSLPFGNGSLDSLCRTFLGTGKSADLSPADKAAMGTVFRERPHEAYRYAIGDAVDTLLLHEEMERRHEEMCRAVGLVAVPPMRPTLGRRTADILFGIVQQRLGECAHILNASSLRRLMQGGGRRLFDDDPAASRFGPQTAGVHGGLLFTRSPDRFWHAADGQLADVDMSGCYARILSVIDVYFGRPVIFEPGDRRMTLAEALRLVRQHADDDAWLLRVTGDIPSDGNTLIPSTLGARTTENAKGRRQSRQDDRQGSKLFSARIESGIVTAATATVIAALPRRIRDEYLRLQVDSIVFYPREFTAASASEFNKLFEKFHHDGCGWTERLDMARRLIRSEDRLDERYVSLRFPLGELAQEFQRLREQAQHEHGRGSGADAAWKQQVNTLFGVLSSPHHRVQNFVAGNILTATARANAWLLAMALNGLQTITDGVSYRRDRIPACTFAECVRRRPDYPLRHADDGIPYVPARSVPRDDAEFTAWLQGHLVRFFGCKSAAFQALVMLPKLEHKRDRDGRTTFDALACDGSGNHVTYRRTADGYEPSDAKLRSYGQEAKSAVVDWISESYPADGPIEPCPPVEDSPLLKLKPAIGAARSLLRAGHSDIRLPLGVARPRLLVHKAIRASAFVFRTPQQHRAIARQIQRFEQATGHGLELLLLRGAYDSERLTLPSLAARIHAHIREDGRDLGKLLNLGRLNRRMEQRVDERLAELARYRRKATERLAAHAGSPQPTGIRIGSAQHPVLHQRE